MKTNLSGYLLKKLLFSKMSF